MKTAIEMRSAATRRCVRAAPAVSVPKTWPPTRALRSRLHSRLQDFLFEHTGIVRASAQHEFNSSERFLDVGGILKEFNPLTGSHLLAWGDSEDDDDAVIGEVPLPSSSAWEDRASGYAGLEYQPSWIDYRDGSESDDGDLARLREGAGSPGDPTTLFPQLGAAMGFDAEHGNRSAMGSLPPAPILSAYSAEAGFQEVGPDELQERLATGQFSLLLDVRSRAEFDSGHIAGAMNLPLDTDLSEAVRGGALDEFRDRPVAVVCGSGVRSSQATVRLTKVFGFANVTNVAGGMIEWAREGLPVQVLQKRQAGGSGGACGCGGQGGGGGCRSKQVP